MLIKITGDRALFAHLLQGRTLEKDAVPFVNWEINGGIPLGNARNLEALSRILQREALDDIVMFPLDEETGMPLDAPVDPSLSCYESKLADGVMLHLTVEPFSVFTNPARAFWVPLSTASVRFSSCGDALSITGANKRRVVRLQPDGWANATALANTNLSNDEINKWTFRITTIDAERGAIESSDLLGADADGGLGATMYAADLGDSRDGGSTSSASTRPFPTVMVGVADDSLPLDETKVFSAYQRCFMLDVASGAFYGGGEKRPTYVDGHNYRVFHGMMVTLMLDTSKGVLNVVVNGRNVLAVAITRYLAESMYPAVEIYSRGAIVDLM